MPAVTLFPRILDFGLNAFDTETDRLLVCSSTPTDYSSATAAALGFKSASAGSLFGSPADYSDGRKIASNAITDGTITTSGTVSCWAAIDFANARLHAVGGISVSVPVTAGQAFTLGSFTVDLSGKFIWWIKGSSIDLDFAGGHYYSNTTPQASLLLHMDGADASTTFTDTMGRHTVTAIGNAQIDTAQSKFGGASALFDGTGDGLNVADTGDFDFGTGDFTIDLYIRLNSTATDQSIFDFNTTDPRIIISFQTSTKEIQVAFQTVWSFGSGSNTIANTGQLYHIALTRSGSTFYLFVDGVLKNTNSPSSSDIQCGANLKLGIHLNDTSNPFNGWMDEVRIIKGFAAWTSSFTPPTAPYTPTVALDANSFLTCSRASIGYAKTSSGTLTLFASNTLRITDLGLLIEDARTNLRTSSQDITSADWNKTNATATANVTAAPDGTTTADSLITTATNAAHFISGSIGTAPATDKYTWSCYYKAAGYNFGMLSAIDLALNNNYTICIDLVNQVVSDNRVRGGSPTGVSFGAEALANGWTRGWITMDMPSGNNIDHGVTIYNAATFPINENFLGDGVSGIYVWGAQVERGAFVSSYIPTTSAAATRAADSIRMAGTLASVMSGAQGTGVGDVILNLTTVSGSQRMVAGDSGTGHQFLYQDGDPGHNLRLNAFLYANFDMTPGNWFTGVKVGQAWSAGAGSISGFGLAVLTGATVWDPSGSGNIYLGSNGGASFLYGYIRRFTAWNSKLADATLQQLTAP
jgi:Concanavalin A-like lectin/glucanases superfamily